MSSLSPISGILANSLGLLLIAVTLSGCEKQTRQAGGIADERHPDEWTMLFDGKTTAGWRAMSKDTLPSGGWTVEDGVLMVNTDESEKGGDIITIEEYNDFILDIEWKILTRGGNSGVKYFVKENIPANEPYGPGLEYQILDDDNHEWMLEGKMKPGDYYTLAALYEIYPAENRSVNPPGEWNYSRIVAKGTHVEHWLNNVKVLEYSRGSDDFKKRVSESKFATHEKYGEARQGHIMLQDHGSKMAFRNIRIKEP